MKWKPSKTQKREFAIKMQTDNELNKLVHKTEAESKLKEFKITIEKKPAGIFNYTEKAESREKAIEKLKNNPDNINDDIVQTGKIKKVVEIPEIESNKKSSTIFV